MNEPLHRPWLVAAWPGIGNVGRIAVQALARSVGAQPFDVDVAPVGGDVRSVVVRGGLLKPHETPRNGFFLKRGFAPDRDLLLLVGERQPDSGLDAYCDALLDAAARIGVEGVVTLAASATPSDPRGEPRVYGAAGDEDLLALLRASGVEAVEEGELGGMNGAFAAAAAARGLKAACFLGEVSMFAPPLPQPKSAAAVLRALSAFFVAPIDLTELEAETAKFEEVLGQKIAELRDAVRDVGEAEGADKAAEAAEDASAAAVDAESDGAEGLPPGAAANLEALFSAAAADRGKAPALKAELDRLGVFKRYEDRFLDLFRPST